MHRYHILSIGRSLAASSVLLLGLLAIIAAPGRPAAAAPAIQPADPVSVTQAMIAAFDSGDLTKLDALLAPGFEDATANPPPGSPPELAVSSRAQFIALVGQGVHVDATNCHATGAATVDCNITATGGPVPVLPHGFSEVSTATVANGQVTHLSDQLTAQTYAELAALLASAPGMPRTGAAGADLAALALALAALLLVGGTLLRRVRPAHSA